jgi:hypothetical protein
MDVEAAAVGVGAGGNAEISQLAEHFEKSTAVFGTSPLYRHLCTVVAGEPEILAMLTARRPGQQASFLLFAAVQDTLLDGAEHPLRDYYASLVPDPREPGDVRASLLDFVEVHRDRLDALIRTRLVQSNVVRRAAGLRYALWAVRRRTDRPVHLVEVGASAGLLLGADRYRYRIGGREFGRSDSGVVIDSAWRGDQPVPDLDDIAPIASRVGIDLNPVDISDPDERRWLTALIWPEERVSAQLLTAAIAETAEQPPRIVAGDAAEQCRRIGRELPEGEPRVVFHSAVRMHVPAEQRPGFDAAIDALGETGPLYHAWIEPPSIPHHPFPATENNALMMHGPGDAAPVELVEVDGHLHWLSPITPIAPRAEAPAPAPASSEPL